MHLETFKSIIEIHYSVNLNTLKGRGHKPELSIAKQGLQNHR